jgi:hypothetical protein
MPHTSPECGAGRCRLRWGVASVTPLVQTEPSAVAPDQSPSESVWSEIDPALPRSVPLKREADLKTGVAGFRLETYVATVFSNDAGDGVQS